jgi:bifunctional DNase/RNase
MKRWGLGVTREGKQPARRGRARGRRIGLHRPGRRAARTVGVALGFLGALLALGARGAGPGSPPAAHAGSKAPHTGFVRMSVNRVGKAKGQYFVLLENRQQTRLLPIVIGLREAQAIQLGLKRISPPRPLTHNLLENTIKALGTLQRVEVIDLRKRTFIGRLTVKDHRGRKHQIDARPSDLIALAVSAGKPIWVAVKVLQKAGMPHPNPPARGSGGRGTPTS